MDKDFWHHKWQSKDIGFHQQQANQLLVKYFKKLSLLKNSRIFLPLCGKTLDIAWLLEQSCRVVGVDLSRIAVDELFLELGTEPKITNVGKLTCYTANNLDVFVGDIFDLSLGVLGRVDAVYDRAALVALPASMRQLYTRHLIKITNLAPQLVICFEYDQEKMSGPPFSITDSEIYQHYQDTHYLQKLESIEVVGGLKGICAAHEKIWFLSNK